MRLVANFKCRVLCVGGSVQIKILCSGRCDKYNYIAFASMYKTVLSDNVLRSHVPSVGEHPGATLRRNSSSTQGAACLTIFKGRHSPFGRSLRDALGGMCT